MKEEMKEMIKKYPNNMDLGREIRNSNIPDFLEICKQYPNDMELGSKIRKIILSDE
jgi:hypothetical protein